MQPQLPAVRWRIRTQLTSPWDLQLNWCPLLSCCTFTASSSGRRPASSVLRDDVGIDAILGQHPEAVLQLEEALRDSVTDRIAVLLRRRKGRPINVETLKRLPASELARACRDARLPALPSAEENPQQLAIALHTWLHAPEAAHSVGSGGAAAAVPASGWGNPPSLRQSNWLRNSGLGFAASRHGTGADAGAGRVLEAQEAVVAAGAELGGQEEEAEGGDAAAEAVLRAAAEREADALFEGELQRRLQHASTAVTVATATPVSPAGHSAIRTGSSGGSGSSGSDPGTASRQMEALQEGLGMRVGRPRSPPPPPPQQQHVSDYQEQQQHRQEQYGQQLVGAAGGSSHLGFLSTTEALAAPRSDAAAAAALGGGAGGGGSKSLSPHVSLGGSVSDGSLFDSPPPSSGPPRSAEVVAAVRRSLGRAGYSSKDPTALRSLMLLSRAELLRLVEGFNGGDLDTPGQSSEQLAARLLHMMVTTTAAGGSSGGSGPPGSELPQSISPPGGARRRAVQWLPQEVQVEGANGGEGVAGRKVPAWDDDRAVLWDARRRQVLAAARLRQELLAAAARPEEIATWLVKARAQDVVLIRMDDDESEVTGTDPRVASGAHGSGTRTGEVAAARPVDGDPCMVLATALSQRHAYACAEAVRYQIRERLEELVSELQSQEATGCASGPVSSPAEAPAALSAAASRPQGAPQPARPAALDATAVQVTPSVSGFNGADWLSLEAGRVQVHVLTAQARRYYRLEELMESASGGSGSRRAERGVPHSYGAASAAAAAAAAGAGAGAVREGPPAARQQPPRVRLFRPEDLAGERLPDTLETARVETAQP